MDDTLRQLVDLRDRVIQKNRIAFSNRMAAIERGDDVVAEHDEIIIRKWNDTFAELENELDRQIVEKVEDLAIVNLICGVKGVGNMLAAKMISMIDITKADTPSALWRYCGYAVIDGERERPTKGEKLHYNSRLKSTLYVVGGSFLKSNSPYRAIYDSAKEYYQANREDWTKLHIHNASLRKMIKMFLAHLWVVWRTVEGLPVTEPYAKEKLNHTHNYQPCEFGWEFAIRDK
jgi:hypothetical protein